MHPIECGNSNIRFYSCQTKIEAASQYQVFKAKDHVMLREALYVTREVFGMSIL